MAAHEDLTKTGKTRENENKCARGKQLSRREGRWQRSRFLYSGTKGVHKIVERTWRAHRHKTTLRMAPSLDGKDLVVWIPKQGARTGDELFMAVLWFMSAAPLDEMIFMEPHGQKTEEGGGQLKTGEGRVKDGRALHTCKVIGSWLWRKRMSHWWRLRST